MRRHAETYDIVLLAVFFEFCRAVALMAVQNKETIGSYYTPLCRRVEMLDPCDTKLICCPAILRDCYLPLGGQLLFSILSRLMSLCLEDDKGWNCLASSTDPQNNRHPLAIASLDLFWLVPLLRPSNNLLRGRDDSHHKAALIKVPGILILYAIFCLCIFYQPKPRVDYAGVLAESSSIVVLSIELHLKLRSPLYKG